MDNRKRHITPDSILLFDLDGTLVETDYANFLAYSKAIEIVKHIVIPHSIVTRFNRNSLKMVIPDLNESDYTKIVYEKEKNYASFLSETKIRPKMVNVLCKYSETNRIVLVTNSRRNRAIETLSYHGLLDKFDDLVCSEKNDIFPNKFVKVLSMLHLCKDKVVLFEDNDLQLKYARDAGIKCLNPITF